MREDQDATQDRVTIQEAARRLGVKEDAIRKRIQRGSMRYEKAKNGRVYVWVEATQDTTQDSGRATQDTYQDTTQDKRVGNLQEQVSYLRRQVDEEREARRRADTIIAQLARANEEQARTIRELGAPSEAREAPETAAPSPAEQIPDDRPDMADEERVIWQRARKVGILSLWLMSMFGVGLPPLLVPSFPLSLIRSGWGNASLALFLFPIVFGYTYGALRAEGSSPPQFHILGYIAAVTGLVAASVSVLATQLFYRDTSLEGFLLYRALPASGLFVTTTLFVLSTMLIGVAKTRKRAGQRGAVSPPSGGAGVASWTPKHQAILGFVGTIITAFFTFFGIVLQVFVGNSGG